MASPAAIAETWPRRPERVDVRHAAFAAPRSLFAHPSSNVKIESIPLYRRVGQGMAGAALRKRILADNEARSPGRA
jgi:hypothetical protein